MTCDENIVQKQLSANKLLKPVFENTEHICNIEMPQLSEGEIKISKNNYDVLKNLYMEETPTIKASEFLLTCSIIHNVIIYNFS